MYNTKIISVKECESMEDKELFSDIFVVPTETVYGLAAPINDEAYVKRIFAVKGRPSDNPLIVHIADYDMLRQIVTEITDEQRILGKFFWPGPLTILFRHRGVYPYITSNSDYVAVRMPANKTFINVIKRLGVPIAAPSANLSGRPSPTTASHAYNDLQGRIKYIIDGGKCIHGIESTVVACIGDRVHILRPGAISGEEISQKTGLMIEKQSINKYRCPGTRYSHYKPSIPLFIHQSSIDVLLHECLNLDTLLLTHSGFKHTIACDSIYLGDTEEAVSSNFFRVLLENEHNYKRIIILDVHLEGLRDRVYKSSSGIL